MGLGIIDWVVLAHIIYLIIGMAIYTKRFNNSVTDFIQRAFCNVLFITMIITAMFMFKRDNIIQSC